MLRRKTYILDRYTISDSGELVVDINVRDVITALYVEFRAQNGATSNVGNTLLDCIEEIQLVDGSKVFYSCGGYEAWAIGTYNAGYILPSSVTEAGGATQSIVIPIFFGRWLGDTDFAFDPGRLMNPQLRVSWDLEAVRSVGTTGFVSGSGRLTIIADVMEGAPAPGRIITAKQHYTFTTAASGWQYIDLPTDNPYRAIYLRSYEAGVGGLSGIATVRLNCDQNKFVAFEERTEDLLYNMLTSSNQFSYNHTLLKANGETAYFLLKYQERVAYVAATANTVVTAINSGIGEQTLGVYTAGTAASSAGRIAANVSGWLPVSTVRLAFGDIYNPTDYFDVSVFRSIRLELEQNNAGADASVVVEQAAAY